MNDDVVQFFLVIFTGWIAVTLTFWLPRLVSAVRELRGKL